MKFYSLKNFIKFFAKIKKVYRNFLALKKKLKKKNFYLLVAGCTILAVVIVSSFQFSNNRHQKKIESNLSTIQKNSTKLMKILLKKKITGKKILKPLKERWKMGMRHLGINTQMLQNGSGVVGEKPQFN